MTREADRDGGRVRKASRSNRNVIWSVSLAAALLILAALAIAYLSPDRLEQFLPVHFSAEQIAGQIRSWGAWAVLGAIGLMIAHSFVPLPSELIAMANGIVFGLAAGALITWVGAMCGAVIAFGLARWLGRRFVEAVAPERYVGAVDEWASRQGAGVLLLSRFLPVISFNLINYAAGLTRVSWWTFLWTTGLGIAPLTFLMVLAGQQMMSGHWTLALSLMSAVLALTIFGSVAVRRRRAHKPTP